MEERVFFEIKHVSQEDVGFRKCKILNEAIKIASKNIIIIDGDCLLHHKFLWKNPLQQNSEYKT